jgi:hypothetical protein
MAEFNYTIEREINGVTHKLPLTRNEVYSIWFYYEDFMLEELIEDKLQNDYGISDFSKCGNVIGNLMYRYNKSRDYGCDEESSMVYAFKECADEIEKIAGEEE